MTEPLLTRRRMLDAFGRLGDHLATEEVVADIHIVEQARRRSHSFDHPNLHL